VHYLRHNFLYGREFVGDGEVNAQTLVWLDVTANLRVHGTTHGEEGGYADRTTRGSAPGAEFAVVPLPSLVAPTS
jgi:hypothetical protein